MNLNNLWKQNMQHFKKLDLPLYNDALEQLEQIIDWKQYPQICINTPAGHQDNFQIGAGSLYYDWDKSENVDGKVIVPLRENPLLETDFTTTATIFKGTVFEDILDMLHAAEYNIGRVRLMASKPHTCLSWHADDSVRLHYPLKTQEGCKMIIENEICELTTHQWWATDTLKSHTAFNASKDIRLHLVVCVL